ncbi:MAG: PadR family transcriptional regulator [Armatimonadota bacterium]|nr:PadR family transcriptional regulator [Armatimonadota bacterium]MDR7443946.1 PadR family transcriptional regulator [Armatimonadota bacterium]MDR7570044.1 PadR family transcriptional regulator [Armatimonadota bacterium]MDR7615451.1 PadR family transcriptional regulator [Armatimonadota bacterium]
MFARPWGPWPRGRVVGRGDLKYLILDVLKDRPMHGYDVLRALQERFGGFYAPSPGAVYPTLQMLEDMGYLSSTLQDGKRVYALTEEGRRLLEEGKAMVKGVEERFGDWRCRWASVYRELWELGMILRRVGPWRHPKPEQLERVREILVRARTEVEAVLREDLT